MKKQTLLLLTICVAVAALLISAELFWTRGGFADVAPEIIVFGIGIVGAVYLFMLIKKTSGLVIKRGYQYILAGLLILSFGFMVKALSEAGMFTYDDAEIIFEILSVTGLILIAFGPATINSGMNVIVDNWKKSKR